MKHSWQKPPQMSSHVLHLLLIYSSVCVTIWQRSSQKPQMLHSYHRLLCLSWSWSANAPLTFCCCPLATIFPDNILISGKLGPSLKDPHCSDVCIWRPYDRRGRAWCLCWCILWDRRCHTRAVTGLLIVPVENKDKGMVWLQRVPRPWLQLGSLPAEAGVPVYHLTRGPHSWRQRLVCTD